jgi:hypothetical protein
VRRRRPEPTWHMIKAHTRTLPLSRVRTCSSSQSEIPRMLCSHYYAYISKYIYKYIITRSQYQYSYLRKKLRF